MGIQALKKLNDPATFLHSISLIDMELTSPFMIAKKKTYRSFCLGEGLCAGPISNCALADASQILLVAEVLIFCGSVCPRVCLAWPRIWIKRADFKNYEKALLHLLRLTNQGVRYEYTLFFYYDSWRDSLVFTHKFLRLRGVCVHLRLRIGHQ